MPLTMAQLEAEGAAGVVSRLVGRRHYLLAMRACQALGLSTDQVRGREGGKKGGGGDSAPTR